MGHSENSKTFNNQPKKMKVKVMNMKVHWCSWQM